MSLSDGGDEGGERESPPGDGGLPLDTIIVTCTFSDWE